MLEMARAWTPETALGSVAVLVILALVAHTGLRWWLHQRTRAAESSAAKLPTSRNKMRWLISRSLRDGIPPVAALIWIHAGYAAASVLLLRVNSDSLRTGAIRVLDWSYAVGIAAAVVWLCWRAGVLVRSWCVSRAREHDSAWDAVMLPLLGRAARQLMPMAALGVCISTMPWPPTVQSALRSLASVVLIGIGTWMIFQMIGAGSQLLLRRFRLDTADNLHARAVHTQVLVLAKAARVIVSIVAFALVLMSFDAARQFGASILASAGIAGIVVGLAAQRSIATLLAGFQIALTQPIRVDDVVVVEGEWGRIESITLTFVVVRIWDERRLVVPITYFIDKPFENWTRTSAELLASVMIYVDFTVPVEALRAEFTRVLRSSAYWDGRVNALQVTDVTEHSVQVRALASATDGPRAWDLRCEVREALVSFLQRQYPESLPRVRTALTARHRPLAAETAG
jgi:small-conductance mechanosensitive channel